MAFNAKKCYVMRIKEKTSHMYLLNDHILETVQAQPYLGVQLSNDLKWTNHINSTCCKKSQLHLI